MNNGLPNILVLKPIILFCPLENDKRQTKTTKLSNICF